MYLGSCKSGTRPLASARALKLARPLPASAARRHNVAVAASQQPLDGDALDQPPPPLYGGFVRRPPVISYERTRSCGKCGGSCSVACAACAGAGRLPAGGYQARNPVSAARVLNSKWTALQRTFGWRHFRVTQKRKEGKEAFVLMVAACDENTQLWLNLKNLKDRGRWAAGWLQRRDLVAMQDNEATGAECKACRGAGSVACPLCSMAGQVVEL